MTEAIAKTTAKGEIILLSVLNVEPSSSICEAVKRFIVTRLFQKESKRDHFILVSEIRDRIFIVL